MKHRYNIRTFVEASSPHEALRLAKRTTPMEVFLDNEVWKEQGFALREDEKKQLGFK